MNQTEQILLQAIQKSLWNTDIIFPEDTDWNAVLKEAEDQAVLGIVIGVAPVELQKEWKARASAGTAHFVRILHYQEQLYKLLKENEIPMVILKGTAAAIYYPNPSQRSMGDIDFLVPPEHFDRAKELLMQNGYTVEDDPRYPRHIHVGIDGISFEMHRYFSHDDIDIEAFISYGIHEVKETHIYGSKFPILPELANGLVLLTHLVHHLKTGVGLRQVIDWMMFVGKVLDDELWKSEFQTAVEQVGLGRAAIATTRICQQFLGLSEGKKHWCMEVDTDLCNQLMDNILSSGNFGTKHGSGTKVETAMHHLKKGGLRYLQTAGEFNWKAYHKHRWLKPFAWVYQIGRYAKQGFQTKRNRKQLQQDYDQASQRYKLLEQLGIY